MSMPDGADAAVRKPFARLPGVGDRSGAQQPSVRRLAETIANAGGHHSVETADDIAPALEISRLSLTSEPENHAPPASWLDNSASPHIPAKTRARPVKHDPRSSDTESLGPRPNETSTSEPSTVKLHPDTVDTEVHQRYASPVTHETIVENTHEIREEQTTRTIHHHDVFHRILPITETEILPARHFVKQSDGSLEEVSSLPLPGRGEHHCRQLMDQCYGDVSFKALEGNGERRRSPRQFTARNLEGIESEYEGTEQVWVHSPTLAQNPDAVPLTIERPCSRCRVQRDILSPKARNDVDDSGCCDGV